MGTDDLQVRVADTSSPVSAQPSPPDVGDIPAPVAVGEPVEVADGVFVLSDSRVPMAPNIGIVVGNRAALVVDTGIGRRSGEFVLDHARRLAPERSLYLTVTHFHPEHGFGAQAFKGVATIIYNRTQRNDLQRKGPGYIELFRGMSPSIAAALEGIELVDPDVVYDGRVDIDLGGHRAVLQTWGRAHTASDQTVFVDDRVFFGGDLFETGMFPIAPYFPPYDTDVDGPHWIEVLTQFVALNPEIVVPGHGAVTDVSVIRDVRDYLDYVRTETARLQAFGATADQVAASIDASARERWSTWANPEWIAFAARSFYDKLTV